MNYVLGIDVYSLNSPDDKALAANEHEKAANWKAVYDAGVRFAYIKATEYNADRDFPARMQYAKDAGILRGPYMLPHFEFNNIAEQVRLFVQTVGSDKGELPPMLDLESPTGNWPRGRLLLNRFKQCLDRLEQAFGRKPIIYTSQSIVREYQITNPPWGKDYDLWVAAYPYADFERRLQYSDPAKPPKWSSAYPLQPDGYKPWIIWQWTSKGRLSGMQKENVDINMFKGTYDDLLSWAHAHTLEPEFPPPDPQIDPGPGAVRWFQYIIKRGDALSVIAQKFHTTIEAIVALNPQITNPNLIIAGETLHIPQT